MHLKELKELGLGWWGFVGGGGGGGGGALLLMVSFILYGI